MSKMVTELCDANPFTIALSSGGPLSSAYKRRAYFKEHFAVVGPVEYVLCREEDRSFQCPYSKKSLHQVLSQEILTLILHDRGGQRKGETQNRAFSDDIYYKTKEFFFEEDPVIAIIIYVDDSGHIKEGKKSHSCVLGVG